jgi:chromate transporter
MRDSKAVDKTLGSAADSGTGTHARLGPLRLFVAFSRLTLMGFGGVLPFAYRMLVEDWRWVGKAEFAEYFAVAQILPGPPIIHIAQMIGHRDSGWRGGAAAVLGIVGIPTLLMMIMGFMYQHLGDVAWFRNVLAGMSAAAVALMLVMAYRISSTVPRRLRPWLIVLLAFACLGIARVPFLGAILVLAPLSVGLAWREAAR